MGILTRGQYTYGNKVWTDILAISQSITPNIGDTVFDTTYNKPRMWDGNNFVHSHQKSVGTVGGILNGATMVVASSANNAVDFQRGSTDTEGVIGIGEDQKTGASGSIVPVAYHGDLKALIAASAGTPATTGNYVINSTTNLGYSTTSTTTAVGDSGLYLDANTTSSGLRRILFRPVERN